MDPNEARYPERMEAKKPRLDQAIRSKLAPILRADGFAGSGHTFRRVVGQWIQVVNVQGSRHGGEFAINLALHPLGVPDSDDSPPDPLRITEERCCLRRRLAESPLVEDQWWGHDGTLPGMEAAMSRAGGVYLKVARRLLERATSDFSDLNCVSPEALEKGIYETHGFWQSRSGFAWFRAHMTMSQGRFSEARAFADVALRHAGPLATGFVEKVKKLTVEIDRLERKGQ